MRVFGGTLRRIPVAAASAAMGAFVRAVMPFTSRHRRVLDNLALALPELTEGERRRIAKTMWFNLGRVTGEAFHIDRLAADRSRVVLPDDFASHVEAGKHGAVVVTAHLGNWEIAGSLCARAGQPMAGVYQALHNPLVERHLRAMREPLYPAGLFSKGPQLGLRLIQLARAGAGIGMVADVREARGIGVRFFGHLATATPLPAILARHSGRPLIAGAVLREGGVSFRAVMRQIEVPATEDKAHDVAVATQRMHDAFEEWIRAAPEQWMWTHRKWARSRSRTLTLREASFPSTLDRPNADMFMGHW